MNRKISRKIDDLIYTVKRIFAFPIDVAAYFFGGIPPSYYIYDQRQGELDARRYEDFCDDWLKKHPDKTIEDFDREFGCDDKLGCGWSKELRHDMICRTGIDIKDLMIDVLKTELEKPENKKILEQLKNSKHEE